MKNIESAWNFIFKYFWNEKTNLLYDYKVKRFGNAWHHLPHPADINRQEPNPCGWGTGMEDSMLSAGSVMDAIVAEYNATGNTKLKPLADKLFKGMVLCADASNNKGFIARSVSPFDKKSYYINSSRDQYTHWVYGAYRFYSSPLCDDSQKREIRRILAEIAKKCERDVTEENDYNLLRADGKIGMVCKMWGELNPHEYLRLPMFYAAAAYTGGDKHFKELRDKYLYEALEKTLDFKPDKSPFYASLQLQYSLRLLYDLVEDEEFRTKSLDMMKRMAKYAENKMNELGAELLKPESKKALSAPYKPWNKTSVINMGDYGGYTYINPDQNGDHPTFYPLRTVGEAATLIAICPERPIDPAVPELLDRVAGAVDYKNHYTYAPLLVACGYKVCLENMKQNG